MAKSTINESQQQGQGITIGTQGNEDQPTPMGDDLNYQKERGDESRTIPHQERSSAKNQEKADRDSGGNE